MFSVLLLLVLLSSPRTSALMSKVSAAAGAGSDGCATTQAVEGLSQLRSSYDAFLIGEMRAGIADRNASPVANEHADAKPFTAFTLLQKSGGGLCHWRRGVAC